MERDARRWDERHRRVRSIVPSPPVGVDIESLPTHGRFLDVACGTGAQSVWAARRGFRVVALDISPVAIASTRRLARQHGVGDAVDTVVCDLDHGLAEHAQGSFDVVVCQRFRAPRLYPELVGALAPGGILVITVFSAGSREHANCRFVAEPGELRRGVAGPGLVVESVDEGRRWTTLVARRDGAGR